jgi:hypothetical protein
MLSSLLPSPSGRSASNYIEFQDDIFELSYPQSAEEAGGIAVYPSTHKLPLPPLPPPRRPPQPEREVLFESGGNEDLAGPETRAFSRSAFLVFVVLGFRITSISRQRYELLSPLLRQLAAACMRPAKQD